MQTITSTISISELSAMADSRFGTLVKAVVDVTRAVMAVDAELHADEEAALLDVGSRQDDLWGINLYPGEFGGPDFIEYDSMINVRPRAGNRSRDVEDPEVRRRIEEIVRHLVVP